MEPLIDLTKALEQAPDERIMDLLSAVMNAPQAFETAPGEFLFLEFDAKHIARPWALYAIDDDGKRLFDWDWFPTADAARAAVEALREYYRSGGAA